MIHDFSSKNSTRKGFFWSSFWSIGNETKTCYVLLSLFFGYYFLRTRYKICLVVLLYSRNFGSFFRLFISFIFDKHYYQHQCMCAHWRIYDNRPYMLVALFISASKIIKYFFLNFHFFGSIWFCHSSSIRFSP